MSYETVFLVIKKNVREVSEILFVCKTFSIAVSKIREHIGNEPGWTERFDGSIWNKDDKCIKVIMLPLES